MPQAMLQAVTDDKGGLGGTAFDSAVLPVSVDVSSGDPIGTPPTPPRPGGEITRKRVRFRRPRPENIRDVRRHIEGTWHLKTGQPWQWTPLYRSNLRTLMVNFRACEVMALWDLYIETDRSVYKLYYMERERERLWMNPRFKPLARKHDEFLIHLGRRV